MKYEALPSTIVVAMDKLRVRLSMARIYLSSWELQQAVGEDNVSPAVHIGLTKCHGVRLSKYTSNIDIGVAVETRCRQVADK
jgi:hypothetical protein